MHDPGAGTGLSYDHICQLQDGHLMGIPQIDRPRKILFLHDRDHAGHQVVHIAETSRLSSASIYGDILVVYGLHDKVGDDPPVVFQHMRSVCVKYPYDLRVRSI